MLELCITVILITTFTSLLFCENVPNLQLQGASGSQELAVQGNIFYNDPENNILLIDFKEVKARLTKIQVKQKDQILMEDKVRDLATDSIYEIDLNTYTTGEYTITLTTEADKLIEKQLSIQ